MLERQDPGARSLLFRALPRAVAAAFAELDPAQQEALLLDLTGPRTRDLLAALSPDDRTELLVEVPALVTRRLLTMLSPTDLAEARQLLGYPEEGVGRLMTLDLVMVRASRQSPVASAVGEHPGDRPRCRSLADGLRPRELTTDHTYWRLATGDWRGGSR